LTTTTPYGLPAIWLRINCQCPLCRDAGTGERLVPIGDLPQDISVSACTRSGDRYEIVFGPDGHQAVFDARWLGQYAAGGDQPASADDGRTEDSKRLWSGADIAAAFPQGSWPLFLADTEHRQACLTAVLRDGFVVLRDVPAEPGTVLSVARHFGLVRETEPGRVVDLEVREGTANHAFTGHPMRPRTSQAYRDPLPTVQFVHCLEQSDRGGESIVIDGFHAAAALRSGQPEAFAMLSGTEVTFAIVTVMSELRATRPVIGAGPGGRIREVRVDSSCMQPLRMSAADVISFYEAYRAFSQEILRPSAAATFRLRPGDCLVLDNSRVLLGRTGAERPRHMQLAWADLDGLASTLAMLRRSRRNGHPRS
jgi:gamma-butyrobetaine dioxygenase